MPVLAAGDNGGRYNLVHRQTDDGLVISVAMGHNLTPLVFRYEDYLGHCQETLLSTEFYPHKRLMRGDCGWKRKDDSDDLLFSWETSEDKMIGISSGRTGEYLPITQSVENCASNVRLCGVGGHRSIYYRKDREYWTPDKTLEASTIDDFFGWTQYNPNSCPPRRPDKCGIVQFAPKCAPKKRHEDNWRETMEDIC